MRAETHPGTVKPAGEGEQEHPAPDPEVVAKPPRRQLTAEYRLRTLDEADRCTRRGGDDLLSGIRECFP